LVTLLRFTLLIVVTLLPFRLFTPVIVVVYALLIVVTFGCYVRFTLRCCGWLIPRLRWLLVVLIVAVVTVRLFVVVTFYVRSVVPITLVVVVALRVPVYYRRYGCSRLPVTYIYGCWLLRFTLRCLTVTVVVTFTVRLLPVATLFAFITLRYALIPVTVVRFIRTICGCYVTLYVALRLLITVTTLVVVVVTFAFTLVVTFVTCGYSTLLFYVCHLRLRLVLLRCWFVTVVDS